LNCDFFVGAVLSIHVFASVLLTILTGALSRIITIRTKNKVVFFIRPVSSFMSASAAGLALPVIDSGYSGETFQLPLPVKIQNGYLEST